MKDLIFMGKEAGVIKIITQKKKLHYEHDHII